MSDVAQGSGHTGLKRNFRDNGDGTFAEEYGSQLRAWDAVSLTWVKLLSDHATGNLNVSGGGTGGGGAATIADGADVAQGTTTDLSSANTVVGILKAIKAAITGTLTISGAVTMASQTPDVTDRAARLLGVVDKGKIWDGTNIATVKAGAIAVVGDNPQVVTLHPSSAPTVTQPVSAASLPLPTGAATAANQPVIKAASTLAVAADTSAVVQQSPMRADASNLFVTATAAVNTALTLTLPIPGAGLFHYITSIQIVKLYSVVGVAAGAGVLITTTNLPGNPVWTTEQLASAAGTAATVVNLVPATPLKSSVANTATTIVCPQQLQTIWRVNVSYYTAP